MLDLYEPKRCLTRAERSLDAMVAAETGDMMRDAWEDFLGHYYRAVEKTCRIATDCKHKKIRGLGWRLVEASNKNDPGLRFLRHARNEVDHAVAPFAGIDEAHIRIGGGAIELGGGAVGPTYITATLTDR